MPDPNLPLLEDAVYKLAPFLDEIVFVGGITLGLLITDKAAAPIRGRVGRQPQERPQLRHTRTSRHGLCLQGTGMQVLLVAGININARLYGSLEAHASIRGRRPRQEAR